MSAAATPQPVTPSCGSCRYFDSEPASVERQIPGLRSLGSGYSSVKSGDGVCRHHGRYLAAEYRCPQFQGKAQESKGWRSTMVSRRSGPVDTTSTGTPQSSAMRSR